MCAPSWRQERGAGGGSSSGWRSRPSVWSSLSPFLGRALYPAATRWLLTGPRLRAMINAQPQYLLLDWGEAVSEKPGHLTIKNLSIRGSDPNVQWIIRLADADVEFDLSSLLRRTFRVTTLRGSGLSFFLRNKIRPELLKTTDTSVLPPVPGFSDPPLRSPDDRFPPPDPKAFLIDVRSVAVEHFDDIWVDAYHYQGAARVDGSFLLKPALHAQIGPAKLTFASGEMRIGKAPDGITVVGDITATFDPFAPLEHQDAKVFEVITAQVKLEGAFQKLDALAPLFRGLRDAPGRRNRKGDDRRRDRPRDRQRRHRRRRSQRGRAAEHRHAAGQRRHRSEDPEVEPRQRPHRRLRHERRRLRGARIPLDGPEALVGALRVSHGPDRRHEHRHGPGEGPGRAPAAGRARRSPAGLDEAPRQSQGAHGRRSRDPRSFRRPHPGPRCEGRDLHLQGHFVREKGKTDGALLIESGILSVGVEMDGKKTTVRPLFAKQWYAKQGDAGAGAKAEKK